MADKYTADSFAADLKDGPYAWPGGYPKFFVTADGGCLCFPCAKKEKRTIRSAIRRNDRTGGWQVIGCDVNWEDPSLFCDNCSERIESAYAEDEAADEARENPARAKARRNASCRAACGMSRKNPTTYARKLPSPFNRFTARDWAHARSVANKLALETFEDAYVEEVFSVGYVAVGFDSDGAYLAANGARLNVEEWPEKKIVVRSSRRSASGRTKRTAGSKRTRKVNQRSNPRRKKAAGARKARKSRTARRRTGR